MWERSPDPLGSIRPATATLDAPWASLGLLCTPSPETSPSSIKFSNSATEALYLSAAQPGLVAVDRTICFHKLWISSVLLVPMLTGHIQSTAMGRGLWSFYVCLLAAHMCWMWACPKTYQQQRRRVIIPLKLLLAACLTSFVPTFVLKEVDSTATYVELVLLGAGLVMQLCTGGCGCRPPASAVNTSRDAPSFHDISREALPQSESVPLQAQQAAA